VLPRRFGIASRLLTSVVDRVPPRGGDAQFLQLSPPLRSI
jgi:hypothetical protein